MNLLYITYKALAAGIFLVLLPGFRIFTCLTGRHGTDFKERLGFIPASAVNEVSGSPRIWIHAASLGEVKVTESLVEALKRLSPDCGIIISTVTESGRNSAKQASGNDIPVIYAPIDTGYSVRKALHMIRPDILVFLETEIWPAWIVEAKKMGIKIALVNGRISSRSVKRYLKLKVFFKDILNNVDAFSMIMDHDGSRIKSLGADPARVMINGNAKYDLLSGLADPAIENEISRHLNLDKNIIIIVAGSTRPGEEAHLLDIYGRILRLYPDVILVIAPRHINRVREIKRLITDRGYRFQLCSELDSGNSGRTEKIIILNTFGKLFDLYSVATLVFCGGSLVPLGGQNPLEPAAWGKPVFYGPHMDNFLDAKTLLENNNASIPVSGPEELAVEMINILKDPAKLKEYGNRARQTALQNSHVAEKHANVILNLIKS